MKWNNVRLKKLSHALTVIKATKRPVIITLKFQVSFTFTEFAKDVLKIWIV